MVVYSKKHKKYSLLHTFGNTWTIGFLTWYFARKNKPIIRELCNDMPNPFIQYRFKNLLNLYLKKIIH